MNLVNSGVLSIEDVYSLIDKISLENFHLLKAKDIAKSKVSINFEGKNFDLNSAASYFCLLIDKRDMYLKNLISKEEKMNKFMEMDYIINNPNQNIPFHKDIQIELDILFNIEKYEEIIKRMSIRIDRLFKLINKGFDEETFEFSPKYSDCHTIEDFFNKSYTA